MIVDVPPCPVDPDHQPGPHCTSPTCDLIQCVGCSGYGTPDRRRWREKRKAP